MKWFTAVLIIVEISLIRGNDIEKTIRAELDKHHKECLLVSKVDPQVLEKAKTGDIDEKNNALVEHIFCVGKLLGGVKNNQLQLDVIKQYFEKQNRGNAYKMIIKQCDSIKNDDLKFMVTLRLKCAYRVAPKGTILL